LFTKYKFDELKEGGRDVSNVLGGIKFVEYFYWNTEKPKVVVEWLTLLLRMLEVLGSNFGPQTGYSD
jgi:hypothetical protein